MSHFLLAVIHHKQDDLETYLQQALAPYEESPELDSPYLQFQDETEEVLRIWNSPDVEYAGQWLHDSETGEKIRFEFDHGESANREYKMSECYLDFDMYLNDWFGYEERDGKYGYWYNPNSKWDWWTIGGRYHSRIIVKPNAQGQTVFAGEGWSSKQMAWYGAIPHPRAANSARIGDIDFEEMNKTFNTERLETYDKLYQQFTNVSGLTPNEIQQLSYSPAGAENDGSYDLFHGRTQNETNQFNSFVADYIDSVIQNLKGVDDDLADSIRWWNSADFYNILRFDRDSYVDHLKTTMLVPYAVLTVDGHWNSQGTMGWFGCSSNLVDYKEWSNLIGNWINNLDPDLYITFVDCHI